MEFQKWSIKKKVNYLKYISNICPSICVQHLLLFVMFYWIIANL